MKCFRLFPKHLEIILNDVAQMSVEVAEHRGLLVIVFHSGRPQRMPTDKIAIAPKPRHHLARILTKRLHKNGVNPTVTLRLDEN